MAREALTPSEFLESEGSVFALAVRARSRELSPPLARLADRVGTPLLDGRLFGALSPKAAVSFALCHVLSLPEGTGLHAALAAAEAHCAGGRDLWVVGDAFPPGPALHALLAALLVLRSSLTRHPTAGRLMVALALPEYPRAPELLLPFDYWLCLPDPPVAPPASLPVAFCPVAVARVEYWAAGCPDLAGGLFRLASLLAYRRQAHSVDVAHVDEAAEVHLARHNWLLHAARVAQNLDPALLELLVRQGPDQRLVASGQLRPATLDQLVADRVLRCAGPRAWQWSSRLHFTAVDRARAAASGGKWVRYFRGGQAETRLYSELQPLLHSGAAELTVDAVRQTVRVGPRVCVALSGKRRGFRLLDFLLRRSLDGLPVVTYDEIAEGVFPDVDGADRTNAHPAISKLRRALGAELWSRLVESVPGVGYRLKPSEVDLLYVRPLGSAEGGSAEASSAGLRAVGDSGPWGAYAAEDS